MDWKQLTSTLVNNYILPYGIKDKKILKAILKIPRHKFVPKEYQKEAYFDIAIPIGQQQTISQPSLVALMTQSLNLKGNEKVLEIGTGSGYQAAILSYLAREVYSVEIIPTLATRAKKVLKKLGCKNVYVSQANGSLGLAQKAPFDTIIVTAGATIIPQELVSQLKENGRIVIPVGENQYSQKLILGIKKGQELKTQEVERVAFVPLVGKYLK